MRSIFKVQSGRMLQQASVLRGSSISIRPENAIEATKLHKTYKTRGKRAPVTALDSIDLVVPTGSFFGLLGPNGAGKSTFINILAGLTIKSAGQVTIWGNDLDNHQREARAAIGIVPQELSIDPFFTPREALELQAGLYGVPKEERRTDDILEAVGLDAVSEAGARTLSGGMRRRLLVAKAMVHSPPVLVLDEPTAGVDIELRRQLWGRLRELNKAGTTIVLTTHYLEEAEQLCDRVAILNLGKVVAVDFTDNLLRQIDHKELILTLSDAPEDVPPALAPYNATIESYGVLRIRYQRSKTEVSDILTAVQAANLSIVDVATEETDLEDIFLRLTEVSASP